MNGFVEPKITKISYKPKNNKSETYNIEVKKFSKTFDQLSVIYNHF